MKVTLLMLGFAALIVGATSMPLHAALDPEARDGSPVLIYVYSPECGACRQFDGEVGVIYPKTNESVALPMERVLIDDWQAKRHQLVGCASAAVIGTPTFLQIQNCQIGSHHGLLRRRALLAGAPENDESHSPQRVTISSAQPFPLSATS